MPDAEQQRSRVEGSKAVLLVPSPSDALPFTDYMSLIGWSSVLWIVGYAPFIPTSPLQFLTYAPLVFGFWLGFRKSGTPWGTYALSGVAVGFLTVVLVCILGLPIQGGALFSLESLLYFFPTFLIVPALVFWTGTLLGHFVKQRALAPLSAMHGVEPEAEGTTTIKPDRTEPLRGWDE